MGRGEEGRGIDIGLYGPAQRFGLHIGQHIEQIADVEADIQRLMTIVDVNFFHGFFLLRIRRGDAQEVFRQLNAHALELVGGENGSALQAALQGLAVNEEMTRISGGNDSREVGELAFHQFRNEVDLAEAEADLGGRDVDLYSVVRVGQQALHFQHRFARHDDVVTLFNAFNSRATMCQPVTVSCYRLDGARFENEQQAVQVVAEVLLRHGKVHLVEQVLQYFLRHGEGNVPLLGDSQHGVFGSVKRLQGKAALGRLHSHAPTLYAELHVAGVRQSTQDIQQLARGNGGGGGIFAHAEICMRRDLHFEIGSYESHALAFLTHQDVRKYR